MNSLTTQLLKKSKTEEGFNSLNRELQDIRSRQENNYRDYYYHGKWNDKECEGDVRKRWERDQELIESFKEIFSWDEKFAFQVEYKVSAPETHPVRTEWKEDKSSFIKGIADARRWDVFDELETSSQYEDFKWYEYSFGEDDFNLYDRGRRTTLVKVSNLQKIEKGFGG